MTHSNSIIATDAFWALIALIFFFVILYRLKIPHLFISKLDERAKNIANELEEARALKEEAQQNLVKYQQKCKEIEEESKRLLERAQREARQIENDARSLSDKYIEQQRKLVDEKMKRALLEASKEVNERTIDVIIAAAKDVISSELTTEKNSSLIDASINKIKQKLL